MDCETNGRISICGNFAELQDSKPEPFDYDHTAKWLEPYSFDWREVLGKTICNCKMVEVHYAPYFGFDYFHNQNCNLMRKLRAEPGIQNLRELNLPAITHYTDSVPNQENIPLYIAGINRASRIKIHRSLISPLQGSLIW